MTREDKLRKAIEEYIGYACEVDECINTIKQRVAFADGANWQYHQFIEKACEWITEHIDIPFEEEFIEDSPVASGYLEYLSKRLEYAKAVADAFKKAMEE